MWIAVIVAALLIGVDQLTKYLALTSLKPVGSITFLEGFMDFTFVENRGVAFGMFSGQKWFILLLTGIIVAVMVYYFIRLPHTREYRWVRSAMVLVLAGALGNMIDRIFRGYVVDFFEFTFFDWPVFNVADIYVVVGVILLAILILFVIKDEPKEKKED
ncbi:signal peptidase II [Anaerotignum lactatifermentans]|uniref:Lipoprotein signal peptidase n=1 Tax=Anaerotignum lactatifermentans TaxID=160404 RepID=A0ABS2G649_9FIRM|nr:signal peptidase II [Anaerotignum lactatifermentans]MBM6828897.1 signal peptidase II [Anaerotignum lactatifermentans]MBM6876929.1 signal peptidase II [Anaerotignum lactatifermentans]MBM6950488.1 signal peptidase II [Anaerotignum lactatifermentans]